MIKRKKIFIIEYHVKIENIIDQYRQSYLLIRFVEKKEKQF